MLHLVMVLTGQMVFRLAAKARLSEANNLIYGVRLVVCVSRNH